MKGLRVTRPNQVWVSDITYLSTSAGFVYLSLVTDARRITGWDSPSDSSGPVKALCRALAMLPPNFSDKLVHHSDRGGQYCSSLYTGILKEHGIQVSVTQDSITWREN
ncbi:MAG: DDE-type integrase/transposase/recombinase [Butyricimonas faecihominis]